MKLLTRYRPQQPEPSDPQRLLAGNTTSAGELPAGTAGDRWTGGTQWATKATTVALWCVVMTGPIGLAKDMLAPDPAPAAAMPSSTEASVEDERQRAAAGEFAQRLITDWLETPRGQEDRLDTYGLDADMVQLPERAGKTSQPAVFAAEESGNGVWAITVGVTVTQPATKVRERHYYQVPVSYIEGALSAQTLPTPVAAPTTAASSRLGYRAEAAPGDPVYETVEGFLAALLTGAADLDRYLAPGATIRPIAPAPYRAVEPTDIRLDVTPLAQPADGDTLHALVTATASTGADVQERSVQYPLTLQARSSRWEVTDIATAPVQAEGPTTGSP